MGDAVWESSSELDVLAIIMAPICILAPPVGVGILLVFMSLASSSGMGYSFLRGKPQLYPCSNLDALALQRVPPDRFTLEGFTLAP